MEPRTIRHRQHKKREPHQRLVEDHVFAMLQSRLLNALSNTTGTSYFMVGKACPAPQRQRLGRSGSPPPNSRQTACHGSERVATQPERATHSGPPSPPSLLTPYLYGLVSAFHSAWQAAPRRLVRLGQTALQPRSGPVAARGATAAPIDETTDPRADDRSGCSFAHPPPTGRAPPPGLRPPRPAAAGAERGAVCAAVCK